MTHLFYGEAGAGLGRDIDEGSSLIDQQQVGLAETSSDLVGHQVGLWVDMPVGHEDVQVAVLIEV